MNPADINQAQNVTTLAVACVAVGFLLGAAWMYVMLERRLARLQYLEERHAEPVISMLEQGAGDHRGLRLNETQAARVRHAKLERDRLSSGVRCERR
jgi:hypothetical protein